MGIQFFTAFSCVLANDGKMLGSFNAFFPRFLCIDTVDGNYFGMQNRLIKDELNLGSRHEAVA